MRIVLTINQPDWKKVSRSLKCYVGVHTSVRLMGRESDGTRSRQTTRAYCSSCKRVSGTLVMDWFTPEVNPARAVGKVRTSGNSR